MFFFLKKCTPRKTNIDTQNDQFWRAYFFQLGWTHDLAGGFFKYINHPFRLGIAMVQRELLLMKKIAGSFLGGKLQGY